MDINDAIFNAVKENLKNANLNEGNMNFDGCETDLNNMNFNGCEANFEDETSLLLKICSGKANEEEKEKWKEITGLSEEVTNQLIESFEKGYKTASEMDDETEIIKTLKAEAETMKAEAETMKAEAETMKAEIKELNRKVDFIMEKMDMKNYSQFM